MAYGKNILKTVECVSKACVINMSLMRDHTSLLDQQTLAIAINPWSQKFIGLTNACYCNKLKKHFIDSSIIKWKIENFIIKCNI